MEPIGALFRRSIHGEVRFIACEGFPSLFLRYCKNSGIRLRYILLSADSVEAVVSDPDFKRVLAVASSLGMRVDVVSKRGLPQFLYRYRRRLGLPVGVLFASLLLAVLSSFVWSVEVEGLRQLDPDAFSAYFKLDVPRTEVPTVEKTADN